MSKFWIQKPTAHNCPIHSDKHVSQSAAVFQDFQPMLSMPHHEWIEVIPVASLASANKALDVAVKALDSLNREFPHWNLCNAGVDTAGYERAVWDDSKCDCYLRVTREALAEIKKLRSGE